MKRNIIFGAVNKILLMLFPFLIRTVMIYKIGLQYVGLNSLFASILQVLNLTELGFSNAIVYSLYEPIANSNQNLISLYMEFYKRVYRIIGLIIIGIGFCILPFLKLFINGEIPNDVNIYILFLIYLFNTAISYIFYGYKNALINAHQRMDIISNISTISQSVMYCFQIVILLLVENYYIYLIMMPVFTVINNILTKKVSDRLFPTVECKGTLSKEKIVGIKNQVKGLMIHRVCQVSRNSLDSIFISAYLGLNTAAIYSNYYYIITALNGILAVLGNSMLAGIGNSIATESVEKNCNDMFNFNFMYMMLSGICTVVLFCLYQPFMKIWVGKESMLPMTAVIMLCVYFYILKMGDIRGIYSDAAGLWWENRHRAIVEAITNLALNAILGWKFGIYGIIMATLISLFVINFIFGSQIIFKYYFKNEKILQYYKTNFKYAVVTIIVAIGCYWFNDKLMVQGVGGLIIRGIIVGSVSVSLFLLIYCKTFEFKIAFNWFRKHALKK